MDVEILDLLSNKCQYSETLETKGLKIFPFKVKNFYQELHSNLLSGPMS